MAVIEADLDATFSALADPTRRAILARLAQGEATVNELAQPFDLTLQSISKHIKVLQHCGLVSRGRNAQFRPCRLEPHALDDAVQWIEESRRVWTERFDQLARHLHDIQENDIQENDIQKNDAHEPTPTKDAHHD